MNPDAVLSAIKREKASAILRTQDTEAAALAMQSAIDGGFRIIEFTLSIPGAMELIKEFSSQPGIVVGAGTVLTPKEAEDAVRSGASYIVSPIMDPEVIHAGLQLNVVTMPGCATPTEMLQAYKAGAHLQKLFPGQPEGPTWIKQILGPLPCLNLVPTSGVTLENAKAYLDSGAFALGFVHSLFKPEDVLGRRSEIIENRAKAILNAI
ncbi:bifunctional 4-hydroxy-2-oxoglutarate aldolase/2-dehydro-3-deoxy-phosphogluconate aldolase [bacterium]|nr:bifunctional 4-hydroxy-2-oxoglutarate aldolase/2-dehydro-3-deoxy-phosphogluconate aldolase [bacterium]MDG1892394.1 bifunctional 4-hydroxy-2-oxoglutarate aldolase/2-dehydro-3-deoxy-phosphogluconate aldolase [Verrucomicrobiota bacterium]